MTTIDRRLLDVIEYDLGIPPGMGREDIRREHRLVEDLGADSLDLLEFFTGVEEEFGVRIDDDAVGRLSTVGDVIDHLTRAGAAE
jgi:acyl carrier protein